MHVTRMAGTKPKQVVHLRVKLYFEVNLTGIFGLWLLIDYSEHFIANIKSLFLQKYYKEYFKLVTITLHNFPYLRPLIFFIMSTCNAISKHVVLLLFAIFVHWNNF